MLSQHHKWNVIRPEDVKKLLQTSIPSITIPNDHKQASELLINLYKQNRDDIISFYFDEFWVILGNSEEIIQCAYMSEINLGINGYPINEKRIKDGIKIFTSLIDNKKMHSGSMQYCIANGWSSINELTLAKSSYVGFARVVYSIIGKYCNEYA